MAWTKRGTGCNLAGMLQNDVTRWVVDGMGPSEIFPVILIGTIAISNMSVECMTEPVRLSEDSDLGQGTYPILV